MKFVLYSDFNEDSIRESLGRPEYSYYFVLKAFRPALEKIGTVTLAENLDTALDTIFADCADRGEPCLFVSFTPPHRTSIEHRHPTLMVLAWEFSTIPTEEWGGNPRNDWRLVLGHHERVVTLSNHTADVVRAAMGPDYPVASVTAPVWDRFAGIRARLERRPVVPATEIRIDGLILDTRALDLSPDYLLGPPPPLPFADETPADTDSSLAAAAAPEPALAEEPAPEPQPPEPQAAEPVAEEPQPEPAAEPAPEPAPVGGEAIAGEHAPESVRKSLRYRLGVTRRLALEWYREVIRDLLPGGFSWLISRVGRLTYRAYRLIAGRRPDDQAQPLPEIETNAAMATAEIAAAEIGPETSDPGPAPEPTEEPAPAVDEPTVVEAPAPKPPRPRHEMSVTVDGVIYTAVINPDDGRKNWWDLVTAFCWTFRDVPDATLILKIVHPEIRAWYYPLLQMLSQLSPFKCRVVAMHGYLEEEEFGRLIAATSYYVNTSRNEGLCLPLMEFMSCGKPALAPRHTAMADYIDDANAFVIGGASIEHNVWPHDARNLFRTERYRMNWECVRQAYEDSYRVAKNDPARYAAMAEGACRTMRDYCAEDVVAERLRRFLEDSGALRPAASTPPVPTEPESQGTKIAEGALAQ